MRPFLKDYKVKFAYENGPILNADLMFSFDDLRASSCRCNFRHVSCFPLLFRQSQCRHYVMAASAFAVKPVYDKSLYSSRNHKSVTGSFHPAIGSVCWTLLAIGSMVGGSKTQGYQLSHENGTDNADVFSRQSIGVAALALVVSLSYLT